MDELTAELKNGKSAAENVVRHLRDMGAAKATIPVEVDGVAYVVCAHEATLQDPRDPRIAALEGEVHSLSEALNSIKLDRESSDVTWCPQCGPHVSVDDEGLCEMCGATSVGAGAARAVALAEENAVLRAQLAAPLRLGRGPTVEESDAHGDGRWIVWLNIVAGSETCQDGGEFICEVPADFVVRYRSQIRDCIPLSSSRQPCGVGVKS